MRMREGIGFPSVCKTLAPYVRPISWKDPNGFYKALGVLPMASDEEIRKAGRALLARYHPDGAEPDPEKFLWVQEAYDVLVKDRDGYDQVPESYVLVTDFNRSNLPELSPTTCYKGWSYFSEVPRVTDDSVAVWAYEQYLAEALKLGTSLPRISVVLLEGKGCPWIEDGLIYVPVSELRGRVSATSRSPLEAQRQG